MKRSHLVLGNPRVGVKNFDPNKTFANDNDERNTVDPEKYANQKLRFSSYLNNLFKEQKDRSDNRTIDVPEHIDYVKIKFYSVFRNDTKKTFLKYGLAPVIWKDFNQTILFAIIDEEKFHNKFVKLVNIFVNSSNQTAPHGEYSIVTIMSSFEFLSSNAIKKVKIEKTQDINITLVSGEESILVSYEKIKKSLDNYLESVAKDGYSYRYIDEKILEVRNADSEIVDKLSNNFDILYKISAGRFPRVSPSKYGLSIGDELSWGMHIANDPKAPLVGIIDTGVKKIDPLIEIIAEDLGIDKTSNDDSNAVKDTQGHGTLVASLVAIGEEFFNTKKNTFVTDARIVPIKILTNAVGETRITDVESAIKEAYTRGVKIFNLSVNSNVKNYNQEYSDYAYVLDKLAYELGIIIFISSGNLDLDDAAWMQSKMSELASLGEDYTLLEYPNHFYNPNKTVEEYSCEMTNLQEPGESMNNITVGAISDNLDEYHYGLSRNKRFPAFYARKFHIDYSLKINDVNFSQSQINYNIYKPDIVMPGGDYIQEKAGMKVISIGSSFFIHTAGSSLSAPLATNVAAKIVKLYPSLTLQSVKALIINNSYNTIDNSLFEELIEEIKKETADKIFPAKKYEDLDHKEKLRLSKYYDPSTLISYLNGHGRPSIDTCLFSSDKKVSFVVQESISINSYKGIKIALPKELLKSSRKKYVIKIKSTLCYAFPPVINNHLSYNPLHISYNIYKTVSDDDYTNTSILSDQKKNSYYGFDTIEDDLTPKELSKRKSHIRDEKIAIKSHVQSWSEDHYPYRSKPFSNVQKFEMNIDPKELEKVDGNITLLIRATAKPDDIDAYTLYQLQNSEHPFSIILSFEEFASDLNDFSMYDSMTAINEVEAIMYGDLDSLAEAEADL